MGNCATGVAPPAPLVIRLVGWTSRIKQNGQVATKVCSQITEFVERSGQGKAVYIIWDGDLLSQDSFTHALPLLRESLPAATFVPIMLKSWVPKLSTGDSKTLTGSIGFPFIQSNVSVLEPDDKIPPQDGAGRVFAVGYPDDTIGDGDWSRLGLSALEWAHNVAGAQETFVFCIGGGDTVAKERDVTGKSGSGEFGKVKYIEVPGVLRSEG